MINFFYFISVSPDNFLLIFSLHSNNLSRFFIIITIQYNIMRLINFCVCSRRQFVAWWFCVINLAELFPNSLYYYLINNEICSMYDPYWSTCTTLESEYIFYRSMLALNNLKANWISILNSIHNMVFSLI